TRVQAGRIPPALDALILHALEKPTEARFGSMRDFGAAISAVAAGLRPAAWPIEEHALATAPTLPVTPSRWPTPAPPPPPPPRRARPGGEFRPPPRASRRRRRRRLGARGLPPRPRPPIRLDRPRAGGGRSSTPRLPAWPRSWWWPPVSRFPIGCSRGHARRF